jgi:hypothetical protein
MTTLQEAEATRDGLRQKLDDARLSLAVLDEARKEIAFEAHTAGGDAEKKLAKMNKDRLALLGDIEMLEIAHVEASRHVADAERAAELAQSVERAGKAMDVAAHLSEQAHKMDDSLRQFCEAAFAYRDLLSELHSLGYPYPSDAQFVSYGERATKAWLMKSPWRWEHLPPGERHEFVEMVLHHIGAIERQCAPMLAKVTAEAAE